MKLYIIPGYEEKEKDYHWLMSKARKKYDVVFLDLQLKNKSLRDLLKTKIDQGSIVFGFSTGALVAFKLRTRVEKGIYCSIADLLSSDTKHAQKDILKHFGRKTATELKGMRYGTPRAKRFIIFNGDKEITPRCRKMQKVFDVRMIKDTGHSFTKNYKTAVLKELGLI